MYNLTIFLTILVVVLVAVFCWYHFYYRHLIPCYYCKKLKLSDQMRSYTKTGKRFGEERTVTIQVCEDCELKHIKYKIPKGEIPGFKW